MHFFVSWLELRSVVFGRIVDGPPITIVDGGEWLPAEMRRLRIQRANVRTAMIDETELRYVIVERASAMARSLSFRRSAVDRRSSSIC